MRTTARPRRAGGRAGLAAAALAAGLVGHGAAAGASSNGDPFAASQWGLRQVGAERAWERTRGRGARVGIVDTGLDLLHPEFVGRVVASTRCIGTGGLADRCLGSAQDDSGHGTHVAGIVAAAIDGGGVAGVAPEASLLVVKALQADGAGEVTDAAAGIDWLVQHHVDVVNLSLSEVSSAKKVAGSPLEAAIGRASDAGVVVVLAAGNHIEPQAGRALLDRPGFDLPAVVVAASDRDGRLAPYSQPLPAGVRWGLTAPGGDGTAGMQGEVVSTYWFPGRGAGYAWTEGTSMAAAHVTGAAALLADQGVRGTAAVDRLLATAAPSSCGAGCRGLLDVGAAVGAAPALAPEAVPTRPEAAAVVVAGVAAGPEPDVAAPPVRVGLAPVAAEVGLAEAVPVAPRLAAIPDPRSGRPVPGGHSRRDRVAWALLAVAATLLLGAAFLAPRHRRRLRGDERW